MDNLQIIQDNFCATNHSFLERLHEEDIFDSDNFNILCDAIIGLSLEISKGEAYKIHFIYSQIVKHIVYHFDPNDYFCIKNLPTDYTEQIEQLDNAVANFFEQTKFI